MLTEMMLWLRKNFSDRNRAVIYLMVMIITFVLHSVSLATNEGSDSDLILKGAEAVCAHQDIYAHGPLEKYNPKNPRDHNKYHPVYYVLPALVVCPYEELEFIVYVIPGVADVLALLLCIPIYGCVFQWYFGVDPDDYLRYAPLVLVAAYIAGTFGYLNIDIVCIFAVGWTLYLIALDKWGVAGFTGVTFLITNKFHFLVVPLSVTFLVLLLVPAWRKGILRLMLGVAMGMAIVTLITVAAVPDMPYAWHQIGDQPRFNRELIYNLKYYPPGSEWKATEVNGVIQLALAHLGWQGLLTTDPIIHHSIDQWVVELAWTAVIVWQLYQLVFILRNRKSTDMGVWLAWGLGNWFAFMLTLPQLEYANLIPFLAILMLTIPIFKRNGADSSVASLPSSKSVVLRSNQVWRRRLGYLLYPYIFAWVPYIVYAVLQAMEVDNDLTRILFDWESSSLLTISVVISMIEAAVYLHWRIHALEEQLIQPTLLSLPVTLESAEQPQLAEATTVG